MSVDGITFEFFEVAPVKEFLKIKQTDENDNILLRNIIGPAADKFVKNRLIPFADSFPLDADQQESAVGAAFKKAVSLYKGHINNFEASKLWKEMANEEIKSIEIALKAKHTPRTRIVISSQKYDTEDDVLFSQRIFR